MAILTELNPGLSLDELLRLDGKPSDEAIVMSEVMTLDELLSSVGYSTQTVKGILGDRFEVYSSDGWMIGFVFEFSGNPGIWGAGQSSRHRTPLFKSSQAAIEWLVDLDIRQSQLFSNMEDPGDVPADEDFPQF
ncbi:MAG: hypothetical protein ACRC62_01350 [Microcoleus sp.]